MGTNFTAVMSHPFTREMADQLPAIFDGIWTSKPRIAEASDALCRYFESTPNRHSWELESYGADVEYLAFLNGPSYAGAHVYDRWLDYWNCARYRGFLNYSEISAPSRAICRELAAAIGAGFVMYLPDWAIDNVVREDVYLTADAGELRQRLLDSGAVLLDFSGVTDDTNLATLAQDRNDVDWPYFIETT